MAVNMSWKWDHDAASYLKLKGPAAQISLVLATSIRVGISSQEVIVLLFECYEKVAAR